VISGWTRQEVELLRALVAQGMTAAEMREHLPGKTRNAILGKMNREGIKSVNEYALKAQQRKNNPPAKAKRKSSFRVKKAATRIPIYVQKILAHPEQESLPEAPSMKTLADIGYGECRAVMSEVNGLKTLFCAAPVKDSSSYCAVHHKNYYIKQERHRG
jgi:hypothetical protein